MKKALILILLLTAPLAIHASRTFNCDTDVMTVSSSDTALNIGGSAVSITMWINPTNTTATGTYGIDAVRRAWLGSIQWRIMANDYNDYSRTGSWLAETANLFETCDSSSTQCGPLVANVWQHLAFTYGGQAIFQYLNGKRGPGVLAPGPITTYTTTVLIMDGPDVYPAHSYQYPATVCDVAIFSVTLNQAQINQLAIARKPANTLGLGSALKGYWPLVGLWSPEPDWSGNNGNGTLTGSTSAGPCPTDKYGDLE